MSQLLVQVGDVIRKGRGDFSYTAMICWLSDKQWNWGDVAPGVAISICPARGDGHFTGSAHSAGFLTYLGFFRYSEEFLDQLEAQGEYDDDYMYREGHTWKVNAEGWDYVREPWWETFRK
ncbi:hypothetical protein PBI_PEREGRIN_251 [Rhodococcus phage Peregrin]|nr:hypothetical protein PBI_PEREGRIN_251 [Rhodococcus phage Peregrin]